MEKYQTAQEIADLLMVDLQTVHRWLKGRKLKGVKAGGQWRIKESDLQAFLDTGAPKESKSTRTDKKKGVPKGV